MTGFQTIQKEVVERLGRLSVTARHAVESALAGRHRSVRRGLSVEFSSRREYQPGDDLRRLDWFVYARTDRYEVRQYEEETKLRATLLVDASGSMGYGPAGATKWDYARSLAAVLAFLMVRQSDPVGLVLSSTLSRETLPPGSTMGHLLSLFGALEGVRPAGATNLAAAAREAAGRLTRRGLVVAITDGFEDPEELLQALRFLRHRKQDVRLFQVLNRDEASFPFKGMIRFEGLEAETPVRLDADRVRRHYLEAFEAHQRRLLAGCHACGVTLQTCWTDGDLGTELIRAFGG
jgi:uncharacterized protein (DUF58 family)